MMRILKSLCCLHGPQCSPLAPFLKPSNSLTLKPKHTYTCPLFQLPGTFQLYCILSYGSISICFVSYIGWQRLSPPETNLLWGIPGPLPWKLGSS